MRVLIAEDESNLRNIIRKKLEQERYSVDCCDNGSDALDSILATDYDCVVLDVMMPRMSGIEVLRALRDQGNRTKIILLTARDSVADRVLGLDAGADDYLVKPFAFEELLARVRVLVRWTSDSSSNEYTLEDLVLNSDQHTASRAGEPLALSNKEFSILEYMIMNTGTVLSRERIENHIWNYDYDGNSNVVDVYIRYLRKKVDDGHDVKLIHTIRGAGYVLRSGN